MELCMNESPQKENGHIDIANEIAEVLARTYLTSYETRILWAIFRKTYGWQKKEDWIAISQFVTITGLHKAHVSRSIKLLCLRNIVTKRGNKISFNKYWSQWKELPNGVTDHSVTKRGNKSYQTGYHELPNGAYTKDTITKDTIQKKYIAAVAAKDIPTEKQLPDNLRALAMFLLATNFRCDTYAQLSHAIGRYARTSTRLRAYSDKQIAVAVLYALHERDRAERWYDVHLETVEKKIIEHKDQLPVGKMLVRLDELILHFAARKHSLLSRTSPFISPPSDGVS